MENMVYISEGGNQALTDSYIVSNIFSKEHNKVCRDIEQLSCSSDFQNANFGVSFNIRELPNGGSKKERFFTMTKNGFIFLVMGYTGEKAAQFKESYINAFDRMEQKLRSESSLNIDKISRKDIARMLLESETERERLENELWQTGNRQITKIELAVSERINRLERIVLLSLEPLHEKKTEKQIEAKKKAKKKKEISASGHSRKYILRKCPGSMNLHNMCVNLYEDFKIDFSNKELFAFFRSKGWLMDCDETFNAPSEECVRNGWMLSYSCGTTRNGRRYVTPLVTPIGYEYFSKKLLEKGGEQ